jgi:hypothetical protein
MTFSPFRLKDETTTPVIPKSNATSPVILRSEATKNLYRLFHQGRSFAALRMTGLNG